MRDLSALLGLDGFRDSNFSFFFKIQLSLRLNNEVGEDGHHSRWTSRREDNRRDSRVRQAGHEPLTSD